ncbi:hypothetical protein BH09BAC1_BH09BAC1_00550 [soil metagenome]
MPPSMFNGKNMYFVYISVLAIAAIYLLFIRPRLSRKKKPPVPYTNPLDTTAAVPNDKFIVVSSISQTDLQEALMDFCSLYNGDQLVIFPRLIITNDERKVVVFPYDIDFDPFCSLVNYLVYPPEVLTEPVAIGWGTFTVQDEILPKEILDKPVMVFVPEEEENHVQLFIVSNENIGYHLQLMDPKNYKTHQEPEEKYMAPPLNLALISTWAMEYVEVIVVN